MRVTVVGHAGSFPGPASPASCYLVQAEHWGRVWSVALDLGNGSLGALQRHLDPRRLDGIALSHLHPDHCLDLCGLFVMRTYQPGGPAIQRMRVFAPAGAPERMARAYGVAQPEPITSQFAFQVLHDGVPFEVGPMTITPMRVNHPVEAFGFRVEADGQVLAYTGDTDVCPALRRLCRDATLVLADCAFIDGRDRVRNIHMSGRRAGQMAMDAGGVRRLMLTHIPSWNDPEVCREQAAAVWSGELEVAVPGRTYQL
jgi:ribonuclease BN (tRNA processing enzyme)